MAERSNDSSTGDFLRKMDARINAGNRRMLENLSAWADILGALGWNVAMASPGGPPLLNQAAARWAAASFASPPDWEEIRARLAADPPARQMTDTPALRIWADAPHAELPKPPPSPVLTRRQAEVLGWIRAGKTGPEIAIILGCGIRTVETHVAAICRKFRVHRRAELIFKEESQHS